ncbi:MAG: hypothetical protein EKK63_11085 [Acinetobacter sp.]|uniref:hypothetical protein n=1 Tax=Acinetobacter sp. TaxID=472 RepID=UPI000FAF6177|nr:hypothetical protein [Acinetobacter sp.]RUP38904.1 MAG: hypothetical protein EKK63_11085 [Acinetobacter sp.]
MTLTSNNRAFALLLTPVMRRLRSCYANESINHPGKLEIIWEGGTLALLSINENGVVLFTYVDSHWLPSISSASAQNPVELSLSEAFGVFEEVAKSR